MGQHSGSRPPVTFLTGRAPRKAVEPLKAGQARCHICRRPVTLTAAGRLRNHKDRAKVECHGGGRPPVT